MWDIGSAGSTTALLSALLPLLVLASGPTSVEVRRGVFQDHAPSYFHLRHVVLSLAERMGAGARIELLRPGYVPAGGGAVHLDVEPARSPLTALHVSREPEPRRVWGIALASRLRERRVAEGMAQSAREALAARHLEAVIESREDEMAAQAGAALALFADFEGGARLGAERAGAPRRSSEAIGRFAARRLIEAVESGATLDRFAVDQVIPLAALARGETQVTVPELTEHIDSAAWLARTFLGADVRIDGHVMTIRGAGLPPHFAQA